MKAPELRVFIIGAGKVGTSLSRALRARGVKVTLRAARSGLPARRIAADLLILAVRDGQLEPLARALVRGQAGRTAERRSFIARARSDPSRWRHFAARHPVSPRCTP